MTRQQAVDLLLKTPAKFGHMLGFTDLTDLHNEWIQSMVRDKDDKTLMASRGTYKTTCVSISLAIIIILLPNYRTMFMRKTDADVKEVIRQVQKILQDAHTQYIVQCIYGVQLKLVTQSTTEVSTNLSIDSKGVSQLVGMGTGGSLTGKHFDRIFTDDIVNVKDRYSRAAREETKRVYQELQNIKNKGGRIFNTGTPWHKEDCFSIMPSAIKYDCYSVGLFTPEELDELRARMSPSLFAANYELKHIADDDVIFANPKVGYDPQLAEQARFCHVDAAYGGLDYTAFTICNKKDGKYYVFGKIWPKHVDDVMDEIFALNQQFMAGKIMLETNGDKGYLAREFKKMGARVAPYHENMNKALKITTYLKGAWNDVYFVTGTDEAYIDQICDYNDFADHDDAPDSLSSVIRHVWNNRGN